MGVGYGQNNREVLIGVGYGQNNREVLMGVGSDFDSGSSELAPRPSSER